jgi:endonuclease/exonuclease/phosphatase (EEP) superfamily protein YafD
VQGYNEDVDASVAVIESVDADIVILQEINNRLADALGEEIRDVYPYQVLDPYNDVRGMGMISKLPLHLTGESLPLEWVGTPQILAVEWAGERVTLVNFHMWAVGLGPMRYIEINTRAREAHALYMIDFALIAARDGQVIVAGDANATPQSDTYRMLAGWLQDSWTEAGYGLGHTFPGSNVPGSTRLQLYGIPVPRWLFRIDYVFHSVELEAVEAFMAPFDGVSDHRALVVTFTLSE